MFPIRYGLTREEQAKLQPIRDRAIEEHPIEHVCSSRQVARLRFIRWLFGDDEDGRQKEEMRSYSGEEGDCA